ncbi:hypothetical protein HDU93_003077 [Gonapodya sp. JEL0774]|nr:hypothetical protein HDU93_003077 [Gonapodya sp. JEL0774]
MSSNSAQPDKKKGKEVKSAKPPLSNEDDEKKFACNYPGCGKVYKNHNGIKYHALRAHQVDSGDASLNDMMARPYGCTVEGCDKRYKNMGGLKYHIEHAHLAELA